MQFTPKTDDQIKEEKKKFEPFPIGDYDIEVMEATDETSSAGNDMIHLNVKITNDEGRIRFAHDYLLEAMAVKLKSFCEHCNLVEEYESGELNAEHCIGQRLRAKVGVEKQPDRDAKNIIKDYLPRISVAAPATRPIRQEPAAGPSNGNGMNAKELARKTFMSRWSLFLKEFPEQANEQQAYWTKACKEFFPRRTGDSIGSGEWMKLAGALNNWTPIDGFKAAPVPQAVAAGAGGVRKPGAVAPPFGDESVFDDGSDIPFRWSGRMGQPI